MARVASWLLVLGLFGVFAAVTVELLRERREAGRGMPAYSVYSEASDGLGEAAHLLRRLGWTPVALTRPVQPGRQRGLLIVVEPARPGLLGGEEEGEGMKSAEAEALLRWVGQGNTLLLLSRTNTPLHQALGVLVTDQAGPADTFTAVELGPEGAYREGVERLSVGTRASLRGPAGALPLWWVGGRPGALLLPRGKGQVLVVSDPGLLTRRGLVRDDGEPRDDNAVFLADVVSLYARGSKVYFDEYDHGIRSTGGFWTYLGYHGERATLLPLLAVLAVAGWRWAVRLGPAVPRPRPTGADGVAYASALGRLYQRAGARRLLSRALVRGFLGALTRHLRLRRQALPAVILAAWRQQHARPAAGADARALDPATARLQTLLRGVNELRRGDVGEKALLAWTRAFDQFREQMEESGGARKAPAAVA